MMIIKRCYKSSFYYLHKFYIIKKRKNHIPSKKLLFFLWGVYNEIVHNKIGDFMRKIRRKREKRKQKIIIIIVFLFLIIMTSGYAAFSTNITFHAKGNIKWKIIDITDNVVTSGDGLYEDEYEEGRYVYKGGNPNNYIEFNGKLWRIISKEADGTYKILRNEALPSRAFDSGGARTTGYCSQGNAPTYGCNAWSSTAHMVGSPSEFTNGSYTGSVDADSEILTYLNGEYYNSLERTFKENIVSNTWGTGAVIWQNNDLQGQITSENRYKWNGNIGLISVSDYIKANSNKETCGTVNKNNSYYSTCKNTNWMYISGTSWWTISPGSIYSYTVWNINSDGYLYGNDARNSVGVRPAVFLNSSISLTGDGTESHPFIIV